MSMFHVVVINSGIIIPKYNNVVLYYGITTSLRDNGNDFFVYKIYLLQSDVKDCNKYCCIVRMTV